MQDEVYRQSVLDHVRGVEKVRHVFNEILIAAPSSIISRSGDSLITAKVKTKLFTLKDIDPTRVKVVTENGAVYLLGLISPAEADRITEVVRNVGGVRRRNQTE